MITLREQYELKRTHQLQRKLIMLDERIGHTHDTLNEAFDKQQMAAAADILKKLNALNFDKLEKLNSAKKAAIHDVEDVIGGGGKDIIRTIANVFKKAIGKEQLQDNPLTTALAFVDGIKTFFEQFNAYIEARYSGNDDKMLIQLLTNDASEEIDTLKIAMANKDVKKNVDDLQKIVYAGLKPDSPLTKLGQNWLTKYLGGKSGVNTLFQQLIVIPIKNIKMLAAEIKSNFKNIESVGNAAVKAATTSATSSTEPTTSEPAAITSKTSATATTPTKTTTSGEGSLSQEKPKTSAADVSKIAKVISGKMNVSYEDTKKIVSYLNKNGKLR